MKALLDRLHAKLGDFWWYSLMLFCACRAADLINAFVGLWIVPMYVDPKELGALLPLCQFANLLALPAAIFAATFRNELTTLAVNREFGKVRTLMRGVFVASAIFLLIALLLTRLVLPHFLTRIRIAEGSLGWIILASAFISCIAPLYNNAIQSLKKFSSFSIINLLGAPIRLIAMVLAMPLRPITGYFVGQASTPVFSIMASLFCLRKGLRGKAEPYWNIAVIKRFSRLFALLAIGALSGTFLTLVETTVLRQRLCDMDSAGYYIATRFSEIAGYVATTLTFTLFPFTAELAAKRQDARPILLKAGAAIVVTNLLLIVAFLLFGNCLIRILPHGEQYVTYSWSVLWMIAITTLTALTNLYTTAECSANRFGYFKWLIPLTLLYPILLLITTGNGYFTNILPVPLMNFIRAINVTSLRSMLWWMTAFGLVRLFCVLFAMTRKTR